jgi:Outer membrane protein beta-barrel domain
MKSCTKKLTGTIAITILLLFAFAGETHAQSSLQLGIDGGGNYMRVRGRSFDQKYHPGIHAGVYGQLNFTSKWSLQPELDFNQVICNTGQGFSDIYDGIDPQLVSLDWISIPVLLSFKPIPQLSLLIGPQYSYLVSQTKGLLPTGQNAFTHSDIALVFGGQLNLGKVSLGVRYWEGYNNICFETTDTWRQYGVQAYITYQLKDIKLKKRK